MAGSWTCPLALYLSGLIEQAKRKPPRCRWRELLVCLFPRFSPAESIPTGMATVFGQYWWQDCRVSRSRTRTTLWMSSRRNHGYLKWKTVSHPCANGPHLMAGGSVPSWDRPCGVPAYQTISWALLPTKLNSTRCVFLQLMFFNLVAMMIVISSRCMYSSDVWMVTALVGFSI